MAVLDRSKRPMVADRDELIFIGIEYPFKKSDGGEGWFASTQYTIDAVKQNLMMLVSTKQGERYMQPDLGLGLDKYLFEQITPETKTSIQTEILDNVAKWLPFIELKDVIIEDRFGNDSNILDIKINFVLNKNPNINESVQITIGE